MFWMVGTSFASQTAKITDKYMNRISWQLLTLFLLFSINIFGQRLKKADRVIVANIQTHVAYLTGDQVGQRKPGSDGEKLAGEYISRQFARSGLKPKGDTNTWFQKFEIYDGKTILPATFLKINEQPLKLYEDYFPLPFSGNKSAESAVAIALAENGVPWFKDLKEITESADSANADTASLIREKARMAAEKGATALILYNSAGDVDLSYNKYDRSEPATIPVLYITNKAFKKYCGDESAILDIALNVSLQAKSRTGNNVIGYADNKADSTVVAMAYLNKELDVAALLEVARLLRPAGAKNKNYLFIAYSGENDEASGANHFKQHSPVDLGNVNYAVDLDTVSVTAEQPKGLHLVRRSVELIRTK